jgi:Uma2 family endonuclease
MREENGMHRALIDEPEIEYIARRAYPKVSPKRIHATVQGNLLVILREAAAERGIVATEWRFKLSPGTEFVPDVSYVSYLRLRALTDTEADEPPFAPDIAGEVRSHSWRAGFAAEKTRLYLQHGALVVLDVDPQERIVHAHTCDGVPKSYRSGERFSCAALPWLEFEVAALFSRLEIPR